MRWVLDQGQRELDGRLQAIADAVGAVRMVLAYRDGHWWCWASFTPSDGAPSVAEEMTLVAEQMPWLGDVVDTAEVWARNLLARKAKVT